MSQNCPGCGVPITGTYAFCPNCGTKIPEEGSSLLNVGDGNAISGGVHISNTKTISSNDVHYHNTIHERNKTEQEILNDAKKQYRESVISLAPNGIITSEIRVKLDVLRTELGLDLSTVKIIEENVKAELSTNLGKSSSLPNHIKQTLDELVREIQNETVVDANNMYLTRLAPAVKNLQDSALHFYYFQMKAARQPEACVDFYESKQIDSYWMTFWSAVAYSRMRKFDKAEDAAFKLSSLWSHYPSNNISLLQCLIALYSYDATSNTTPEHLKHNFESIVGLVSNELHPLREAMKCQYGMINQEDLSGETQHYLREFVSLKWKWGEMPLAEKNRIQSMQNPGDKVSAAWLDPNTRVEDLMVLDKNSQTNYKQYYTNQVLDSLRRFSQKSPKLAQEIIKVLVFIRVAVQGVIDGIKKLRDKKN